MLGEDLGLGSVAEGGHEAAVPRGECEILFASGGRFVVQLLEGGECGLRTRRFNYVPSCSCRTVTCSAPLRLSNL